MWRLGAVRVSVNEPFQLASGKRSPLYINGRQVIGDPGFVRLFVTTATALLAAREVHYDVVAGGETAGIPYASFLAASLSLPMAYIRKQPKGYGLGRRVEGATLDGRQVLLVEDLITDGGSKVGFLEAIVEAGGRVADALVLFDREQGGCALLARHGVTLHAATDLTTTLDAGVASGLLAAADRAAIDLYLADPDGWPAADREATPEGKAEERSR
jgi:orotate phosphoribosyltransferase